MNREGPNVKMSLNFERLVSKVRKAANPVSKRDYSSEAGVELQGKMGEQSHAPATTEGEDRNKVNASKLLEKVLDNRKSVV